MSPRMRWRGETLRILRYALIGLLAAATHYSVALGLTLTTPTPAWLANIAGFLCGFAVSYTGQSRFTFTDHAPSGATLLRWFTVALTGVIMSSSGVALMVNAGVAARVALLGAVVGVAAYGYLLGRFWVFRPNGT